MTATLSSKAWDGRGGLGNAFREISQERLMIRLRDKYNIKSVLNCPYDQATDPNIDNKMFPRWTASKRFPPSGKYDLVWNFGFVQRNTSMIWRMVALGRMILMFTPNYSNCGMMIHKLNHMIRGSICNHPERGFSELMTINGLSRFIHEEGYRILETGYVDCPPWPDTVSTLTELFGSSNRSVMNIPFTERLLIFEKLTMKIPMVMAHHCWILFQGERSSISPNNGRLSKIA